MSFRNVRQVASSKTPVSFTGIINEPLSPASGFSASIQQAVRLALADAVHEASGSGGRSDTPGASPCLLGRKPCKSPFGGPAVLSAAAIAALRSAPVAWQGLYAVGFGSTGGLCHGGMIIEIH